MFAFQQQQLAFIARIKDPQAPLPAGMNAERMQVYQELFFNNIQGFVSSAFPALKSLLPAEDWTALCRQFFQQLPLESPYFLHISKAFLGWLQNRPVHEIPQLPVFAAELAAYEWQELALSTAKAQVPQQVDWTLAIRLELSPLVFLGQYQFAVHRISRDQQPDAPADSPTFLLLYRNQQDEVRFIELNALAMALLQLVEAEPGLVLEAYLQYLQPYLPALSPAALQQQAADLVIDLFEKTILTSAS